MQRYAGCALEEEEGSLQFLLVQHASVPPSTLHKQELQPCNDVTS